MDSPCLKHDAFIGIIFLQAESDSKEISALDLDFSSFESIRGAAKKLTDDYQSGIDILVNCASAGLIPCEDTNDGFGKKIFRKIGQG